MLYYLCQHLNKIVHLISDMVKAVHLGYRQMKTEMNIYYGESVRSLNFIIFGIQTFVNNIII